MLHLVEPHSLTRAGRPARRSRRPLLAVGSTFVIGATAVLLGLAPPSGPSAAQQIAYYNALHGQSLEVSARAEGPEADRDAYGATPGVETFRRSGTNRDWAQLILLFAGWPQSEDSITVIMRWMRQENYPETWWLRNNPLNNGWGADGGSFLGGNPDLVDAARDVADALLTNPGYREIREAFARGASTSEIEHAIWYSPWATGHYDNGGHWHYHEAKVVKAPASAWGL